MTFQQLKQEYHISCHNFHFLQYISEVVGILPPHPISLFSTHPALPVFSFSLSSLYLSVVQLLQKFIEFIYCLVTPCVNLRQRYLVFIPQFFNNSDDCLFFCIEVAAHLACNAVKE